LVGCPKEVGGYFNCVQNSVTSLVGSPKKVGGDFFCHINELPRAFYDSLNTMEDSDTHLFIKYMHYFNVWTPEFNIDGMIELIGEIKDGLL
jgi:hypothetical protein